MKLNTLPSVITQTPAVLAFENEDPTASKEFHKLSDEPHKVNYMKKFFERIFQSVLHGAIMGLINNCAVVGALYGFSSCGFIGNEKLIICAVPFGFTLLLVHGFSLSYNEFLKREEYVALYNREKKREKWECDNYIEGEQKEMVQLYMERGLSHSDAESVIKILSKDISFFVELMMKEELEMIKPDEAITSLKNSALIFVSTLLIGSLPLFPFFVQSYFLSSEASFFTPSYTIFLSLATALMILFAAGALKSSFTVTSWWMSGLQLIINGIFVFGMTYFSTSRLPSYLQF